MAVNINTVTVENVTPEIDQGKYPVKRVVGDFFEVEADIFTHGHDIIQALVLYRKKGEQKWLEARMEPLVNDRWRGAFRLEENAMYQYTVLAWRDEFLSWAQDLRKKHDAGVDIASDLLEGKMIVEAVLAKADEPDQRRLTEILSFFDQHYNPETAVDQALNLVNTIETKAAKRQSVKDLMGNLKYLLTRMSTEKAAIVPSDDPVDEVVLGDELRDLMTEIADRSDCGKYDKILEVFVDRPEAQFASWYEMWPRSQGTVEGQSATFADMEKRLDEIKGLGFHVVYLTPIHPIGKTNRKGPNNSLECPPGSPGCPYAIGNEDGGHTAIEPGLGTIEDFKKFEQACRARGMEVALDIALQASPDHPWVKQHPKWFKKRPDGSIKYAENPPKKYEDIYPIDFNTTDKKALWQEMLSMFRFWIEHGVKIFRIDNPHTKPFEFWEWLIAEIRKKDPDVLFLAEAFTRPKVMKALAKMGYTQSYSYFTWRNFKEELTEYFTELTQTEVAEYMRVNLFVNTPDILPEVLQHAPPAAFKMRAVLATTLGSVWGMYNGFELCEGTPVPGKEEYLNSEKYDYKVWDWERPGNIKEFIGRLNHIRNENPALQLYRNLHFYAADNDNILFYAKYTKNLGNIIMVIVNLDPYRAQETLVHVPIHEFGIKPDETYQVHDLLTHKRYYWRGEENYVRLDPDEDVAHVFQLMRWTHRENDFDYYV
ncbi:MAG: alpha-1,4-glucan--maltose-1-phosphate maltosyltransferase [SAR324 cluster bacterium]|nr:alpha-1,4-glucan--maltose-1-phosphate maltosyltransferase [SAR324 cluster bacterium]